MSARVHLGADQLQAVTTPAKPPAGAVLLYAKADGNVYKQTSDGVESPLSSAAEPPITAGTASQFWRGDKTWAPLNGANLLQNPGFEDMRTDASGNNSQDPHTSVTGITFGPSSIPRSGLYAAQLRAAQAIAAQDVLVGNGQSFSPLSHPRVSMGETYRAEFWVRNGVTGTTNPTLRTFIKTRDYTGTVVETAYSTTVTTTATYQLIAVELTVANTASLYVTCGINAPNGLVLGDAFRVDDMALRFVPPISTVEQSALDAQTAYAKLRDFPVNVATLSNLTSLVGSQTVDGLTLPADTGYTVLVKNQTTASQNGVYFVNSGAWTRVPGFSQADSSALVGGHVRVTNGTNNTGSIWTTNFPGTSVGTSAMNWYRVLSPQTLQSGTVAVTPAASSGQVDTIVTFPIPYAVNPPNVVVSVNTGSTTVDYKVWVGKVSITTTQFTLSLYRANTTTMTITWMALPVD